jgi:hypothetical protein
MSTTSALNDWANALSMDVAESRASAMGGSLSGEGGGGSFGSFSASGETGGGDTDFPDWLKDSDLHELENEYAGVDKFFNIRPKIKPIRNFAEAQYSNALQTGANAADEAVARAFQSGIVGPINTTMISAQAAMPALMTKLGAEKDIAGLRIQNMYKQQQARADLAAQIAGMRKSYVDTMAQFALGQGKLNLEGELGRGALDLQRDQFDFTQDRYADSQSSGTTWEELANLQSSWNSALGASPGAAVNWQRFLGGLTPGTKSQTADFSLLGLA